MAFVAFRSESIALKRGATSAQALAIVATSCLRQIAQNERGIRDGSAEAVHQMRIGLRRLRAAVSIFKDVLQGGELERLKGELVWLTEQLGEARNYDVLIASKRNFIPPSTLGATELGDELADRREEAFAAARRAVSAVRFERLIVTSAVELILRADGKGAGARAARDLAREVLERRARRVLRRLGRFARLGARERHELRIQVKKLRYGTEFFAALFPNSRRMRKRFSRSLEALQDTLGRLNDITTHQRIAAELVEDGTGEVLASRRIALAMGTLTGNEQAEEQSLIAHVPELATHLAKAPRFWR